MWLVLFKRLATTTTHYDLNNFYQNRHGKPPGHDIAHDPVHYAYSDCRIVNMQLLYRASDRQSLDFYRSYLAERLYDKDSGTVHWILRIYATRVSFQLLDVINWNTGLCIGASLLEWGWGQECQRIPNFCSGLQLDSWRRLSGLQKTLDFVPGLARSFRRRASSILHGMQGFKWDSAWIKVFILR
jgi:hypothetical protein